MGEIIPFRQLEEVSEEKNSLEVFRTRFLEMRGVVQEVLLHEGGILVTFCDRDTQDLVLSREQLRAPEKEVLSLLMDHFLRD